MPIIFLPQDKIPTHYLNILPRLPFRLDPPLDPQTKEPIGPDKLGRLFPQELIKQEMSSEPDIEIPEEVRKLYALFRPTPLIRAKRLEEYFNTPAKIYYKYEGFSPTGSHKTNTAIPQAYYNAKEGVKRLVTETGAGQWGTALSFACNLFKMECQVYMVSSSFEQKPYRKILMQMFNGKVVASPSNRTKFGQKLLKEDANHPGSLGIAISEALEDTLSDPNSKYALGSVLNHVLLHQTIIGLEAQEQLKIAGDYPQVVIGCHGGGSNFAGIALPFLADKLEGKVKDLRLVAAEPKACPSLTEGEYKYDAGDTAQMTPLLKMKTLGSGFIPPRMHAGGLRYHGAAPITSALVEHKLAEAVAFDAKETLEAGILFARLQGIVPAPESTFAIKAAFDEVERCRKEKSSETILFNLSGHGHFDMAAYEEILTKK